MKTNALTLTVIANMTSNYGEGLGNIASVQKVYRNGKEYATRSRESLKNAICVQSGFYDDLQTSLDGAMQKLVTDEINAATCRALEGGYMSTKNVTYIRNSSFYLTDAVAAQPFINDARFHNNLYLATNFAKANGLNVQNDAAAVGLMPYQYEYDKSLKIYSITIDLEKIGVDENFNAEADNDEKCSRVIALLDAVENLSLVVKGNLDNAEPVFVVGGMSLRKTHMFENAVQLSGRKLIITPIKQKLNDALKCAMLQNGQLSNEDEIVRELNPVSVPEFFSQLKEQVKAHYAE
ncbi:MULTISPECIES: type I-B CRISPR-associated protein Cas7/Cst2/DevR [unclassified Ruminococcus]|uniref:type I-B CRISPR-associated protein Cas7/Cst2/DevR n=1 Tax=unclassified Ruminococcus TaxID=2608920 RepID=UPI00210B1653|nr:MULTISPECIES: type I-B CRISPR-associated protein Cas7/Cst2/DevR [unclassified Ruminococcus]MCQ4023332.1 type I-B CRISPR-associated protein Cas7/Cst2/DevR [Ruminococcus sp. zg-924]MCQ4115699.1 type I-B CRISPR-associated protein Cas7/Cst2/DevR [Ruminococcus sp. zg-921]